MKHEDMLPRSERVCYHAMVIGATALGVEWEGTRQRMKHSGS